MADEEHSRRLPVGGRPTDIALLEMADFGSESVAVVMDEGSREHDVMKHEFVKIGRGIRTDTEGTMVACDDGDDESGMKEVEE